MSLRFALLGLLAEAPASGYDLTQRFEQGIGSFAWTAKHSQIYPELTKLAGEGLVELVAEGARGRREYGITASGRASLRAWLVGPHTDGGTVRNEFVLRLFLLSALDDDDARRVLAGVSEFAEAQVAMLQDQRRLMDEVGESVSDGPGLAAMFGIFTYRATRDWADWAVGQLGSGTRPAGEPGSAEKSDGALAARG